MRTRVLFGSLSLALVMGAFLLDAWLDRPIGFLVLVLATMLLGLREYFALTPSPVGGALSRFLVTASGTALLLGLSAGRTEGDFAGGVLIVFLCLLGLRNLFRTDQADGFRDLAFGAFGFLYLCLLPSYLVRVRILDPFPEREGFEGYGLRAALLILLTAKACDVGAYYAGRALGRRKLLPLVSPKKTWAGAVGGVLAGVLAALLLAGSVLHLPGMGPLQAALLGVLLSVAAQLGDLVESQMKRAARVKDSSALIPGLGGVLDLVDSLIFSSPVGYLYFKVLLARGAPPVP